MRLYEMFIGPLDATKPWTENGVKGVYNFLRRVATFFGEPNNLTDGIESKETLKFLHQTIKKVGDDIEDMKFNTAISQMMVFTNHCYKAGKATRETANIFYQVLAPFAPHLAEELWSMNGNAESVGLTAWPLFNPDFLTEEVVSYPVSFNGKVRFKLELPVDFSAKQVEEAALASEMTKKWTKGNTIVKIIVVPGKIVNIVLKPL